MDEVEDYKREVRDILTGDATSFQKYNIKMKTRKKYKIKYYDSNQKKWIIENT